MSLKYWLPGGMLLWVMLPSGFNSHPAQQKRVPLSAQVSLSASDSSLVEIFNWSRDAINSHQGNPSDPVGPWYEAALPNREAFCIRDVSHQCIGNEIAGQGRENLNMMRKFVGNISASKDYCSYWEINRYDKPAPVDYTSDQDFWYNLNANFDLIDAAYKLYQWTGNTTYITSPEFDRFFRLTLNEYVERWQLEPGKIMQRPAFLNRTAATVRFREARGIPSYDEAQEDMTVSADLLAISANGFSTYAKILGLSGKAEEAKKYRETAATYTQLIDSLWWDPATRTYFDFYKTNQQFYHGGTAKSEYLLWYQVIRDSSRIARALQELQNSQTEVLSYLPMIFYRYGFAREAYAYLKKIYADPRRMYPEASSGAMEGFVRGMMGVEPAAAENRVSTCSRLPAATAWVEVRHIPVFSGLISVKHVSADTTIFSSISAKPFTWRAVFRGAHGQIQVGGKRIKAQHFLDALHTVHSFVDVPVAGATEITAVAL